MSTASRPPAPKPVRLALTLIVALIFYRLFLVYGTLEGLLDTVRELGEGVDGGSGDPAERAATLGFDRPRIPGSLGSPLLFFAPG